MCLVFEPSSVQEVKNGRYTIIYWAMVASNFYSKFDRSSYKRKQPKELTVAHSIGTHICNSSLSCRLVNRFNFSIQILLKFEAHSLSFSVALLFLAAVAKCTTRYHFLHDIIVNFSLRRARTKVKVYSATPGCLQTKWEWTLILKNFD